MLPKKRTLPALATIALVALLPFDTSRAASGAPAADTPLSRAIQAGHIRNDRVVVRVDATSLDQAALSRVIGGLAGSQVTLTAAQDPVAGFREVRLGSGVPVAEALTQLRSVPGVTLATPDVIYHADLIPTDPQFGHQWSLNNTGQPPASGSPDADIDAPEAWDTTTGTAATVVAVVDSGVQLDHGEFTGRIWTNPAESSGGVCVFNGVDDDVPPNGVIDDCHGWDFVDAFPGSGTNAPADNDPSPCGSTLAVPDTADCNGSDDNGDGGVDNFVAHGTHVAGIIGAAQSNSVGGFGTSGVAPGVTIMPVRALTEDGFGDTAGVVAAMNYAISEGAKVINMSFGSQVVDTSFDAVTLAAAANDVVLVAAAGNANENLLTGDFCDSPVCNDDPGGTGANGVIGVAATTQRDHRAFYSNYSSDGFVDVAAPGGDVSSGAILSTCYDTATSAQCSTVDPADVGVEPSEYTTESGTSQATPHVAGVVALVRSQFPALTAPQVTNAVLFGADDITVANKGLGGSSEGCGGADCTSGPQGGTLGHGRLNAAGAFAAHLVGVAPGAGTRGTLLDVTLTGVNTSWNAGSLIDAGQGIGVSNLNCASSSSCTATFNLTNATPLGPHTITVTTGAEVTSLSNSFTVSNAVLRVAGSNRVQTAIETSKIAYPTPGTADAVILARKDAFPDSLSGTPFATAVNGPLLFTGSSTLDPATAAELQRVLKDDSDAAPDIYLLGQTSALSSTVENAAAALRPNWSVKRIGGANRSETSVAIAEELHAFRNGPPDAIVVATQANFPDALAAAVPAADPTVNAGRMPVLLTDGKQLSAAVQQYLAWHGASIQSSYVVGGTSAVSDTVASDVDVFTAGGVRRLSGSDRYATAAAVDDFFYTKPISASFASGKNFPDALAGSYLSALHSSPMLLINGSTTPQRTIDYVQAHATTLLGAYMFGGTAVIPESVRALLESIL